MEHITVTLLGREYPVVFTMKTLIAFEDIVGHSFFSEKFEKMSARIALVIAAIGAANPDADITANELLDITSWDAAKQLVTAYSTVMELAGEFFRIPEVEKLEEPAEEGEQQKN